MVWPDRGVPAMTTGRDGDSLYAPADLAALMLALAEAGDSRSFFATLCRALPRLLPGTRVDLLVRDWADGICLPLLGDAPAPEVPAAAGRGAEPFAEWLASCGYRAVAMQPLNGVGRCLGWLALARRHAALDDTALALAGQLAALTALRLLHEHGRDQQVQRDDMLAALERRLHLHEELRLRATLAVGTAHDIGNLLASVIGRTQLLQALAPAPLQPDLRAILCAAADGHALLRRLITLKSADSVPQGLVVELAALARDAIEVTRPFWDTRADIQLRCVLHAAPQVRANAADIREVLVNLIINAIEAMPGGGTLRISSACTAGQGIIEVADSGHGIALEHQARIFQQPSGPCEGGHGFGLSISRALAESHGGTLTLRSAPGQGATFSLALPLVRPSELVLGAPPAAAPRAIR